MSEAKTPTYKEVRKEEWDAVYAVLKNITVVHRNGYPNAADTYDCVLCFLKWPFNLEVFRELSPEIRKLAVVAEKGSRNLWKEVDELNEKLKESIEKEKRPTIKFSPEEVEAVHLKSRSRLNEKKSAKPEPKTFKNLWGLLKRREAA